jgi:hypothetical protein
VQIRSDLDPFLRNLLRVYRYIAKIQSDAELYPLLGREESILLFAVLLDSDRTTQGLNDAVKFSQQGRGG